MADGPVAGDVSGHLVYRLFISRTWRSEMTQRRRRLCLYVKMSHRVGVICNRRMMANAAFFRDSARLGVLAIVKEEACCLSVGEPAPETCCWRRRLRPAWIVQVTR